MAYALFRHLGFEKDEINALKPEGKSKHVEAHISFAPHSRQIYTSLDSVVVSAEWKNKPPMEKTNVSCEKFCSIDLRFNFFFFFRHLRR